MKTIQPAAQDASTQTWLRRIEGSVLTKIGLTVVLAATLVAAIHWAFQVTRANARQVSTNLSQMQDRIGSKPDTAQSSAIKAAPGPILEPDGGEH